MRCTISSVAAGLLILAAALTPARPLMAQSRFPEPDQLPSHPELPDPLVMFNGERVTSKQQWIDKRRPELKALFQHYMYGYLPQPAKITAKVEHEDAKAFDGKATLREVAISVGPPDTPPIHLLLVIPNKRKGPAPVFVGINFCGNHAIVNDRAIHLPTTWIYPGPGVKDHRATEAGRGKQIDVWALEQSIDRGYAVATFYNGDIDPDQQGDRAGIQPYLRKRAGKHGPHDWGTIAAWAWGVHRVVDYVSDRKDLDKNRIAVVGHSRLGKTALLAAALDERIALAIPHQAGCGGTSPDRNDNPKAESVRRINTSFPHWFNDTFKQFNDRTDKLPFDQHCLIALMTPRPVLLSNAVEDQWANPSGQFRMLQAADPVYRFLGVAGLEAKQMPPLGKLVDSPLGYYIREGKHSMTKEDWKIFLDFADKHFGR
jgi:(4-O-methyl)-D-glucuronate---lignin esterase